MRRLEGWPHTQIHPSIDFRPPVDTRAKGPSGRTLFTMDANKLTPHLLHISKEHQDKHFSIVVLQIDETTAPAELLRIQDAVVRAARLLAPQAPLE